MEGQSMNWLLWIACTIAAFVLVGAGLLIRWYYKDGEKNV